MARTLLLVDDDPDLAGSLGSALASWRIVSTADHDNAARVVRAHRPSVALVSFFIPPPPLPAEAGEAAGALAGAAVPGGEAPCPAIGPAACPAVDGLAVLADVLAAAPATKVVMLDDGRQPRSAAVRAVAEGAHDVFHRSGDVRDLALLVDRAHHRYELEAEFRRAAAPVPLRAVREQAERRAVQDALSRSSGNLSAAARLLEVSRPTLYNLIRQHGIREA
ncbi:helix-turn-helix domain-containing protein [Azospirillum sp. ST 5-10]|uniref:helix-turn-helix domain-containing protein n=1 Tax=unclassified Azospirillum TaxID=2630922 RepID=UPI003F49D3C6